MHIRSAILAVVVFAFGNLPALADKRVALVIGNGSYASYASLPNAPNDATKIAQLLNDAKFDEVTLETNLDKTKLIASLQRFSKTSAKADIAVVYYAGHGVELGGRNFLLPVDAKFGAVPEMESHGVNMDAVVEAVRTVSSLRLIILDACRNNPFTEAVRLAAQKTAIIREDRSAAPDRGSRGLAPIEVNTTNTYVAFAAKAGSVAFDGEQSANSPFTKALLSHLTVPGLDIRIALGRVRDEVIRATNYRQEPYVYGSVGGDVVSLNPTDRRIDISARVKPVPKGHKIEIGTLRTLREKWEVRCELFGSPPRDRCGAVQQTALPDRPGAIMAVVLVRTADDKGFFLRLFAPTGVLLTRGTVVTIDGKQSGKLDFVKCDSGTCVVELILDKLTISRLNEKQVTFTVYETSTASADFSFSFAGMEMVLSDLPKELSSTSRR